MTSTLAGRSGHEGRRSRTYRCCDQQGALLGGAGSAGRGGYSAVLISENLGLSYANNIFLRVRRRKSAI
jgi:hypothetical protein